MYGFANHIGRSKLVTIIKGIYEPFISNCILNKEICLTIKGLTIVAIIEKMMYTKYIYSAGIEALNVK